MLRTRFVTSCLLSLLLLVAAVRADLEVELPRGGLALATLSDPAHMDRWLLRIPGGSVLSITVKTIRPKGGERPGVAVRLLDPDDVEIAAGTSTKSGAKLKKVEIPTTGVYVAEVKLTGTTTGEYQVRAKWKTPKKAKFAPTLTGDEVDVPFVADTGGTASFKVKGKKGVTPVLLRVASVSGAFTLEFDPPVGGATKHIVKGVVLGVGGEYVLTVAGAGGDAKGTVTVKPPKKPKGLFVITDEVVDPDDTGEAYARGSVIGPAGGRVEVTDDDAGLSGSAVHVPEGALDTHVPVLVGTGPEIEPADEEVVGTGPTVRFGPAGLTFAVDSEIEIPFDPEQYGGDFTGLEVVQREADGTETVVPPASYTVDPEKRIVSFPVRHFTSFRAFGPAGGGGPPPPEEIFFEDFESGWGLWWSTNGVWEVGEPTSGPGGAFGGKGLAATVLAGNYPDWTASSIVSPDIVLPEIGLDDEIQVRFWHWYSILGDDRGELFVQEETDPGVWGNTTAYSTFTLSSAVWGQYMADVSQFAGKKIRFSFYLWQDTRNGGVDSGWYIDDFSVSVRTIVDMSDGETVSWGFEDGLEDWWIVGANWQVGEPTSGPGAAHDGEGVAATLLSGNYVDWSGGALVSPSVQLPEIQAGEEIYLRFWHWFSVHGDDALQLMISEEAESGVWTTWTELGRYTLDSGVWSFPRLTLSPYAGKKVRIIFYMWQDPSRGGTDPGWYVDEVTIQKN